MSTESFYIYRKQLPHWRLEGATYFVTWRTHKAQRDLAELERSLVAAALLHFNHDRYEVWCYVVMNDHVHVLVQPKPPHELQGIVQSWKSFTANTLQRRHGRQGPVWQEEYMDRILRDEAGYLEKMRYILGNPSKRWPDMENYPWVWIAQD